MNHYRPFTVATALLLATAVLSTSLCAQEPLLPEIVAGDLGARIDSYMTRAASFGMSGTLLVARNGEVVVHKSYGLADRRAHLPLEEDMPMLIGSLGKQFTAAAILKLEMEGKLSTSDTVGRFFPDAPADKRGITLHQLLTHTAGYSYLPAGNLFEQTTRPAVMKELLEIPLERAPGSGYAYSSPGYTLLAGVVERASGERFEKYLRRVLFEPAGMTNTGFEGDSITPYRGPLVVHSYSSGNDEGAVPDFPFSEKFIGAGTIISTAADLYRWEQALATDRVLNRAAREKFFTPYVDVQGPTRYAYGWNVVNTLRNTRMIYHGGDIGGYNAEFRRYVDEGLTLIFTSNGRENGAGYRQAIMNPLSLMINGGAKYPEPPTVQLADTTRYAAFAGRYELAPGGALSAWIEEEKLMLGGEGGEAIAILSGAPPDTTGRLADVERRAKATLDGLATGKTKALEENLHPSIPMADMRDAELAWWRQMQDSLGAVTGIEIVGGAMISPVDARTYHRITFERGSMLGMYGWSGGKIVETGTDLSVAMATPFLPEGGSRVASFDLFSGRTLRATFGPERNGRASTLTIHTSRGDVVARRVEG
jgi:CubicO group peptidase (beta-lactamase class C family)